MRRSSSSTSSSDSGPDPESGAEQSSGAREPVRIAAVVALSLALLAVMDLAVNLLFAMPDDPNTRPNKLQQYFDYGRSIEGKLRYLVRDTDAASAPIVRAGWLDGQPEQPSRPEVDGGRLVAVYGQSMSHRVAHEMAAQDPSLTLRLHGGPAAPLGHSFELFRRDRGKHDAQVVVLGVVASGLRALTTMTGMCWGFEAPAPFTYPRWYLENGELRSVQPEIASLAELRAALSDPALWNAFVDQLAEHDLSFSPVLFHAGPSDQSALLRTTKRGWGQRVQDQFIAEFEGEDGARRFREVADTARAMMEAFGREAREDGAIPVVLLFHDKGMGDLLYRELAPTLQDNGIAYLSTHDIAPSDDMSSYVPDGHFRRSFDEKFARRVLEMISTR